HFEAVRHARAIYLRENVAGQISLEVQVLNLRETVRERLTVQMAIEDFARGVAAERTLHVSAEHAGADLFRADRDSMQVRVAGIARERLESRLAAEYARRPVQLRVEAAERSEQRLTHESRQATAEAFLHRKQLVTAIAGEVLIATVAGQCNRDVTACELA